MSDLTESAAEKAAHAEITRLCQPGERWRMTIPVNGERDSDMILSRALDEAAARREADAETIADLHSRLACVVEATYWDRGYDTRIAAIRGMCDLTTNGMTPQTGGAETVLGLWEALEATEARWSAALDDGCPSCGDHIEGYHHALSDLRAILARPRDHPPTAHQGDAVTITPKGAHDLSGWTQITCWQAEIVRRGDLRVASSLTDVEKPDVFTEWWSTPGPVVAREVPVLREYRDYRGCRHYLANEPSSSAAEDDA